MICLTSWCPHTPFSTVLPAAMESWPVHRTCYLSQTSCFQLSRDSRSGRDTLNDRLWKANWHLLLGHVLDNLHPAQPEEDWPPLIAWFLSRFVPRFWYFYGVFSSFRASTPALLAVWGFRLGFCTALWDISWCKKGYINAFDLILIAYIFCYVINIHLMY